jgi:hypothetical protein
MWRVSDVLHRLAKSERLISLYFIRVNGPLAAIFTFSLFVISSFADDLRGFALLTHGMTRWFATAASYLVPNFSALNVITAVAHQQSISPQLILQNSLYALFYTAMALSSAVLVFERRNLK